MRYKRQFYEWIVQSSGSITSFLLVGAGRQETGCNRQLLRCGVFAQDTQFLGVPRLKGVIQIISGHLARGFGLLKREIRRVIQVSHSSGRWGLVPIRSDGLSTLWATAQMTYLVPINQALTSNQRHSRLAWIMFLWWGRMQNASHRFLNVKCHLFCKRN